MEMETTLATQSSIRILRESTKCRELGIISSTPDGKRGISIYRGQPPFTEFDFEGVTSALKSSYPALQKDTPDNEMFFSLLKTAARRSGFSKTRLKEAVMNHIMTSPHPPKVSDIMGYDLLVEVLGWRKVEDMPWPHEPIAKLFQIGRAHV